MKYRDAYQTSLRKSEKFKGQVLGKKGEQSDHDNFSFFICST